MALPCIVTGWSGPTAFMTKQNSFPVDIEETLQPLFEKGKHFANHLFAVPKVAHLRQLMRRVVDDPKAARAVGAAARQTIVEKFSLPRVATIIAKQLSFARHNEL